MNQSVINFMNEEITTMLMRTSTMLSETQLTKFSTFIYTLGANATYQQWRHIIHLSQVIINTSEKKYCIFPNKNVNRIDDIHQAPLYHKIDHVNIEV